MSGLHTGLLWFDNSNTIFTVKIQKAAEYYCNKYRKSPTLVLVHPSLLNAEEKRQFEVEGKAFLKDEYGKLTGETMDYKSSVRPYRPVLPGHIWIGIEDKN